MQAVNRVVFNTIVTYVRAIFTAFVSLYTTRLVLSALGAEDFGLYNVIGGVIVMLSFLNSVMTTSTQRFISHSLGAGKVDLLKKIFANSVISHFLIGIIVLISIELIGVYFLKKKLTINPNRVSAGLFLLHCVALSTFITIISVPYDAVIVAHENMVFIAIVNVIESFLKLAIAVILTYSHFDKLMLYGFLIMLCTIIIRIIKRVYSKRKYKECDVNLKKEFDKKQIKELSSFAGWQLFGNLAALGRNEGIAIVLNLFFATVVNAAYGVANQLNGQMMFFSESMLSATRPQIMKSEGANDRERTIRLALTANKFAFYLFTFFAVPLFFEMPFILKLWLKSVPTYSVEFCRSIILLTMISQINQGVITAVQAIGKIKNYQMVVGGILLLTIPIGYFFLKYGYPPYSIIIIAFILECISTLFRIFYFNHLTGYPILSYFKNVIFNAFISLLLTVILVVYVKTHFEEGWLSLITILFVSSVSYLISIYFIGLNDTDRKIVKDLFQSLRNRVAKKGKI